MTLPIPKPSEDPPAPAVAVEQESFVINLCSSTTPMALTQPELAQLKDYTFFVSRRLEDGRERFRLHMGYFDSLLQAEDLLQVVRDIYPGAWAGEAPGKRLRAKAQASGAHGAPGTKAAAKSKPVIAPLALVTPTVPAATQAQTDAAPTLSAAPDTQILANAPTLQPQSELTLVAPISTAALAVIDAPVALTAPVSSSPTVQQPAAASAAPTQPVARAVTPKRDAVMPFEKRSNVREVLKSLDESGRTRQMPKLPEGPAERAPGVLPESQVMRLQEEKRGDPLGTTSTPAAFAVQLQWSVQAIDLAKVPPLAIFGAYTLYTVEGSRGGRRWYGLRLGFFTDANSAKQVAQYVRSEFASVAVVPVSLRERDGASGAQSKPAPASPTLDRVSEASAEFKLLDDTAEKPKLSPALIATLNNAEPAKPPAKSASGRATDSKVARSTTRLGSKSVQGRGKTVHAREKRAPQTLEETLEILGADELQVDSGKRQLISEGMVRHMDVKVQKNSALSRLLDRLAERNK